MLNEFVAGDCVTLADSVVVAVGAFVGEVVALGDGDGVGVGVAVLDGLCDGDPADTVAVTD